MSGVGLLADIPPGFSCRADSRKVAPSAGSVACGQASGSPQNTSPSIAGPMVQVRNRLSAGGASHERTRLCLKFPVSRENTGNFIDSELSSASKRAKKALKSVPYEPIPYAPEQGIFCGLA